MRTYSFIGAILLILLPFAFIRNSLTGAIELSSTVLFGLLWFRVSGDYLGFRADSTETFSSDWLKENGYYNQIFGDLYMLGILVLILLLIVVFLALTDSGSEKLPGIILIVCGFILFILRFLELSNSDRSFYESSEVFGLRSVYLEIPLGFIFSLIFGIMDIKDR